MRTRIGLVGVGHLGKIHLQCLQQLGERFEVAGFFDIDPERSRQITAEFGLRAFPSYEALLDDVQAVDIVTPTTTHFELARQAIEGGRHTFIEKPVTELPEEARRLSELARTHDVRVQVGHVERFNPALLALRGMPLQPMFIEAHRLAAFNPRGTDVSVVLDLMIHDLDIVLSMVEAPVKSISAGGVPVVSDQPDISNARIEFENGCIANLTASRISLKQMRKLRLFQPDAYISLDFLEKQAQIVRLFDQAPQEALQSFEMNTPRGKRWLTLEMPPPVDANAIRLELEAFADAVQNGTPPVVSIHDGYRALALAHDILGQIHERLRAAGF